MTDYPFRPATDAELITGYATEMRLGWPVRFRHFTLELYSPNAKNGVQHRQHSRSKLTVVDGVPFVRHHGKMERVTATIAESEGVRPAIFDLRLASEYLP